MDLPQPSFDEDMLRSYLDFIIDASIGCMEMRVFRAAYTSSGRIVPGVNFKNTYSGYFTDPDDVVLAARRLQGVSGYATINPVSLDCMAREAAGRLIKSDRGAATSDDLIVCRRWLYLDFDACRTPDISATEGEMKVAMQARDRFLGDNALLAACSMSGCSGNGAWVLVRVGDLPNTERSKLQIQEYLKELSKRYTIDKVVNLDTSTYNASRVVCLPGTLKCKGSHTKNRPWRLVTIDHNPLRHDSQPSQN